MAWSPDSRGSVALPLESVASMDFKSTSGECQNWQQRIDPSQLCSVQWPIMLYPEGCHYDPAALPQFIATVFSCCFRKWLLTIQVLAAYTIQSSEAVDPAAPPVKGSLRKTLNPKCVPNEKACAINGRVCKPTQIDGLVFSILATLRSASNKTKTWFTVVWYKIRQYEF